MKKQLTAMAMIGCMMTATAQAFVPLSNSQINLGSFRNNATRGMFYTELDIFSASPVEIGDTEGNYIYTNWANLRTNSNLNNSPGVAGPLAPGAGTYDAPLSYTTGGAGGLGGRFLTLGMSGQPLWFLPVVGGIRAGVIFQNSGAKFGSYNFDGDPTGTFDLEFTRTADNYLLYRNTQTAANEIIHQETTGMKYFTDSTTVQWNAGAAWKDFILKDFDIGASFSRISSQVRRTTGGTKKYSDAFQDDQWNQTGSTYATPSGTRELHTYSATYMENNGIDMNSVNQTDLLAQARLGFLSNTISFLPTITAGAGLRLARNDNPGGPQGGLVSEGGTVLPSFEINGLNASVKDYSGPFLALPYYTQRDITRSRVGSTLDNPAAPTAANFGGLAALTTATAATTDFKDSRTGAGPLARLELSKKFDKVTVTALGNFSAVKQTIDASQTLKAYDRLVTPAPISTDTARVTTLVAEDYNATRAWTGSQTNTLMDAGGKLDFTAMEGVRLALGGFISQYKTVAEITSAKYDSTEITSYNDGNPANDASNPAVVLNPTTRPSAVNGEGTWTQTRSLQSTSKVEATVTQIAVPVGVEIPLSKKWTFRAGTRYVMQKAKATTKLTRTNYQLKTVAQATGGATTTYYEQDPNPVDISVTTFPDGTATGVQNVTVGTPGTPGVPTVVTPTPETHYMEYSYGIQFDPTKSLSLAANAFLDTNPGGTSNASIFDLNTYRLLAIQAVFKF